jgi:hypothetical protein
MAPTIAAASEICSGAYVLVPVACYFFGVATGILLLLFDHKQMLLFGGRGSLCKQGCASELGRSSEAAPQPDVAPQRSASCLSSCASSCHSSSSLDDAALLAASAPNMKPRAQPLSLHRRRRPNLPAIDVNDHTDALGCRSGSKHYVKVEIPDASSRAATSAHLACTDDFGRSPSAPDETKMKRIRDMWLSQRQRCNRDGQGCCGKASWHRQHREEHCRDVRKMSLPRLPPTRARRKSAWAESLRIRAPLVMLRRSAKRTGNLRIQRPGKSHAAGRCEGQTRSLHCSRARISSSPGHHRLTRRHRQTRRMTRRFQGQSLYDIWARVSSSPTRQPDNGRDPKHL